MSAVPYAEVIGDPIAHSKSPTIHKFWLAKLGMEGDYRHCLVRRGELGAYLSLRTGDRNGWRGRGGLLCPCSIGIHGREYCARR